ncbi:MAG: DUF2231 domain-containing protein [bacterium JZ-2024 1]
MKALWKGKILFTLFALMPLSIVFAHEKEEHKEAPPGQEFTLPANQEKREREEETLRPEKLFQPSFLLKALTEHPHNKVVHFPIALALIAFLFSLLGYRYKFLRDSVGILVLIAALSGVASYFTGLLQIEEFIGEPEEWLAILHRNAGIATTASLWLWFITFYWKAGKKFSILFALLSFFLVTFTSFLGGILAH